MKFIHVIILLTVSLAFTSCSHHKKYGKHFQKMDDNGDEKISKEEWANKFDLLDADKDGFITKEEMKQHHKGKKK